MLVCYLSWPSLCSIIISHLPHFTFLSSSLIQCYDDKNCMPSSSLQCWAVCKCVYYSKPRHPVIQILLLYVKYRVHLATLAYQNRVVESPRLILTNICKLCSLCVLFPASMKLLVLTFKSSQVICRYLISLRIRQHFVCLDVHSYGCLYSIRWIREDNSKRSMTGLSLLYYDVCLLSHSELLCCNVSSLAVCLTVWEDGILSSYG